MLSSCSGPFLSNEDNYSTVHGDSGISGRSFSEIVDEMNNLASVHTKVAKVISYGTSPGGAALTMIRIASNDVFVGKRPGVVIEGTIHGDEFLNIEDRLPRWFLENQNSPGVSLFLKKGGVIWIAPILNPDGYAVHRRENNKGQDLNRDFDMKSAGKSGFTQPETKSLIDTIKRETVSLNSALKLTLDYHCCVGALIYPWGFSETKELPAADKAEHKRLASMMLANFNGYRAGRAIEIVNYTAVGAADDFYYESMGASAFTFEGARGVESRNFEKHTRMWDQLLGDIANKTGGETGGSSFGSAALAIGIQDASGQWPCFIGSERNSPTIEICSGNAVACLGSDAKILTKFQKSSKIGDRYLFQSKSNISFSDQQTLTIVQKDASETIEITTTVSIRAK